MRRLPLLALSLAALAALGGCRRGSDDAPGGVTANEKRALDDAAEMVEERQRVDPAAIPAVPVGAVPAPQPSASPPAKR